MSETTVKKKIEWRVTNLIVEERGRYPRSYSSSAIGYHHWLVMRLFCQQKTEYCGEDIYTEDKIFRFVMGKDDVEIIGIDSPEMRLEEFIIEPKGWWNKLFNKQGKVYKLEVSKRNKNWLMNGS